MIDVVVTLSFNNQPISPPVSDPCPDTHKVLLFRHIGDQGRPLERERFHFQPKNLINTYIPRIGYNTLYPFILQLLYLEKESDLPPINRMLDIIENPNMLWTEYGLRSLAAEDIFYWKDNAPGDRPYWR